MNLRMKSVSSVVAALVLVGASSAHGQGRAAASASCNLPRESGVSSQQLMSGGRPRMYRLFVPPGYDGHERLALVLDLHGSGGSSAGQSRNSGFEMLSASGERFIVATLDAVDARWNVPIENGRPDDVAYVSDVIDHVAARLCTDVARVYATGFSGGARMTSLPAPAYWTSGPRERRSVTKYWAWPASAGSGPSGLFARKPTPTPPDHRPGLESRTSAWATPVVARPASDNAARSRRAMRAAPTPRRCSRRRARRRRISPRTGCASGTR